MWVFSLFLFLLFYYCCNFYFYFYFLCGDSHWLGVYSYLTLNIIEELFLISVIQGLVWAWTLIILHTVQFWFGPFMFPHFFLSGFFFLGLLFNRWFFGPLVLSLLWPNQLLTFSFDEQISCLLNIRLGLWLLSSSLLNQIGLFDIVFTIIRIAL